MRDTIRNAFKSLDDIMDVKIEPVKKSTVLVTRLTEDFGDDLVVLEQPTEVDTAIEQDELEGQDDKTLRQLFEESGAYVLTHDFDVDGVTHSLFIEGLNDGESCDVKFDEFDIDNITDIIVEILDGDRNFLRNISDEHPEWNELDVTVSEVVEAAQASLSEPAEEPEEEEEEGEERVIIEPEDETEEPQEVEEPEESEAETQEKIAKHIIPDHSKQDEVDEGMAGELEESKSEGRDKFNKHHALFAKISHKEEESLEEGHEETLLTSEKEKSDENEEPLKESKEFNLMNKEEAKEAKEILDKTEEEEPIEQIVDVNADTVSDLKKTYIGDAILQCPTCKTMIYKEPDELIKPEEGDEGGLYNEEEECPHCGATDGFELVGQVASLDVKPEIPGEEQPVEEPAAEQPVEQPAEEPAPSEGEEPTVSLIPEEEPAEVKESLTEDDGNDKVWGVYKSVELYKFYKNPSEKYEFVKTGLTKEEAEKEAKAMNTPDAEKRGLWFEAKRTDLKEEYRDVILESFDEAKFDRLAKKYLNEVYSNIESYATIGGYVDNQANRIIIEGRIKFTSGKFKTTKFVFEAKEITKRGKVKLVGLNEMFAKKKAFTLIGTVEGKNLLSESLTYSYNVDDKKVYGQVKNPTKV